MNVCLPAKVAGLIPAREGVQQALSLIAKAKAACERVVEHPTAPDDVINVCDDTSTQLRDAGWELERASKALDQLVDVHLEPIDRPALPAPPASIRNDAEIKAAWASFCRDIAAAEAAENGSDEEAAAEQRWNEADDIVCELPVHTLDGVLIKLRRLVLLHISKPWAEHAIVTGNLDELRAHREDLNFVAGLALEAIDGLEEIHGLRRPA